MDTANDVATSRWQKFWDSLYNALLSVPVRVKISGIILLPVLILGLALNYWVTNSLSDWLSYLLTDVRVEAAMRAGGRSVILVTVLSAAGSLLLAAVLAFLLTRPLLDLRDMARRVAAGELDTRAPVWSNDEIGDVAVAINTMTDHLVAVQDDLARSNRQLQAINNIMVAAERESEIHDVLYAALENTLKAVDLDIGWVHLYDPERDRFHLASWYNVPEALGQQLLAQQDGPRCACQEDMVQGRLAPDAVVRSCRQLASCPVLEASGVPGLPQRHAVVPIEARGQQFGVMNLLCTREHTLSDDDLNLLSDIGAHISEIVANAWLRLKLEEKEMARQALLESLVEAQEEERGRLARELHDGAGQMLTSLLVGIKALERRAEAPAVRDGLESLLDMTSETIEQIRELSYRLRPAALEQFGLAVALETLVEDMAEETGIAARCDLALAQRPLPGGVDVTLYRIAQESLTNVVRHAQASEVLVALASDDSGVTMRIEDNGRGFAPHLLSARPGRRHLGLISMRERAAIVGGQLDVYSAPGEGTAVEVFVPVFEAVIDGQ